ncbi:MAG: TIM-barrel domain-containing protein [Phycisphaerae bacterium]
MARRVSSEDGRIIWRKYDLTLWVEPCGPNAVRIRATRNSQMPPDSGVLLAPQPCTTDILCAGGESSSGNLTTGISDLAKLGQHMDARLVNGELTVELSGGALCFRRSRDGAVLLRSQGLITCAGDSQGFTGAFSSRGGDLWNLQADFEACADERFCGLGQHRHGLLDQKGCVLDLFHHNCEINVPFAVSSRGYGFIWNNPSVGHVELAHNRTRWVAEACRSLDYVVIAGETPASIVQRYADITGHAPVLPEWAAGFWQCKLRYKTQDELLRVAREYKHRGLPLSVIVIDFMHWLHQGDWKFDPEDWPDPSAMVRELSEMGVRVMVSVWPTVNRESENFAEMLQGGMLVGAEHGVPVMLSFHEPKNPHRVFLYLSDPTHPATREFIWDKIRQNYVKHGIKTFWLDAIEPELITHFPDFENMRYHEGSAREIGGLYPWYQQKLFHDGLAAEGETEIVTLGRSAFLGSQRFGAAVWNGDIQSSFEALAFSVPAGLNMAMSGIPWWTTDIGGFWGADIQSEYFRELVVRWFQYAAFCPLFRLHGDRRGGDNEVWSFGEQAYAIIQQVLAMRERLRPYIMEQMKTAARTGLPPMRPLLLEFPGDPACWDVKDQFAFGSDILVCPVTRQGATSRQVYLPSGVDWVDAFTKIVYDGGQTIQADAPLERIPLYVRKGVDLPIYG